MLGWFAWNFGFLSSFDLVWAEFGALQGCWQVVDILSGRVLLEFFLTGVKVSGCMT
jgi:hypothetical protein